MKLALVQTASEEGRRLAALDRFAILDMQPEHAFDDRDRTVVDDSWRHGSALAGVLL